MIDLTARQIQILRAVIEEYIETAEPVGSDTIDKKFNIGVSPATIRNEMVLLTKQGYLRKTHSSAGRVPTPVALKLYVNELLKEKELSVADEVSAKEKVWKSRDKFDSLLHEITKVMADRTHSLSVAITSQNQVFHSGYANLLSMPEFSDDLEVARQVLVLIEEVKLLEEIFEFGNEENVIRVVYGAELSQRKLEPVGFIFTNFSAGEIDCHLGVIGSPRFDYAYVLPMMRYVRALAQEFAARAI